jgi:glycosyltransferase involved in cell wall biosynthesis
MGGVETHVMKLSEELRRQGQEVEVATTDPTGGLAGEETINGIKIMRFKSWAPSGAYYYSRSMRKFILDSGEDYDIVHAHNYHALPSLDASKVNERIPFVVTPHFHGASGSFLRSLFLVPYANFARKIFSRADKIICVSNYERNLLESKFKGISPKQVIIPNGINKEEFESLQKKDAKESKQVLFIGRLERYKHVQDLIASLTKVDPSITLCVVGEGPYMQTLVTLTKDLGLQERVKFYGRLSREEILQRYGEADLYAMLSDHEAFGLTVAEALAAGLRCIVSEKGGLIDWVDGSNCFGVKDPKDHDLIGKLITQNVGMKTQNVHLMGWNEVAKNTLAIYEGLA